MTLTIRNPLLLTIILCSSVFFSPRDAEAKSCTASTSGNWRDAIWAGTGCPGSYPVAGDSAIITSGAVVTVPQGETDEVLNLTLGPSAGTSGTLINNGTFSQTGSTGLSTNGTPTLTQGTNASLTIGDSVISGSWAIDFSASGNTVTYNYTGGTQTIFDTTYHNLVVEGGAQAKNAADIAALTVNGNLTVNSGIYRIWDQTHTVNGTTTVAAGASLEFKSTAPTHIFGGLVTVESTASFAVAAVNPPLAFRGGITNNGTFSTGTGLHTFNTNDQAIGGTTAISSFKAVTVGSGITLTVNKGFTLAGASPTLTVNGTITPAAGEVITSSGTGTETLTGTGTVKVTRATTDAFNTQYTGFTAYTLTNLTVDYAGSGQGLTDWDYTNLTISGTVTSGQATANGTFSVTGSFTPTNTAIMDGAGTLTGRGTVKVTKTSATPDFNSQYTISNKTLTNLTVEYAGAVAQAVTQRSDYGNLKINNAGYTATLASGTTTVNGNLNIAAGTLAASSNSLVVKGNWANIGAFTANTSTVTFNGTGNQTISGDNSWYNLAITGTAARSAYFESAKTQTIASGGSLALSGALGQLLSLLPTGGTAWLLNVNAAAVQDVSYASVSYSNAGGGATISPGDTVIDAGSNTNWSFIYNVNFEDVSLEGVSVN